MTDDVQRCRRLLAAHGKSFALAARLLSRDGADAAAVVYAWCRRADDAIDLSLPGEQREKLAVLRDELASIAAGEAQADPVLAAFGRVARERAIPLQYAHDLLDGMEMDVEGARYATLDDLLVYCFRVAGVVGLMMCHVLGVRDTRALRHAAHLGMAMQLTNICRDVVEDWNRGRLYVPEEILAEVGGLSIVGHRGGALPANARRPLAHAVRRLLERADGYYRSADEGLDYLSGRAALGIRTARLVYSAIGRVLGRRGFDPTRGRAVVPFVEKIVWVLRAVVVAVLQLPSRLGRRFERVRSLPITRYPEDVLPV